MCTCILMFWKYLSFNFNVVNIYRYNPHVQRLFSVLDNFSGYDIALSSKSVKIVPLACFIKYVLNQDLFTISLLSLSYKPLVSPALAFERASYLSPGCDCCALVILSQIGRCTYTSINQIMLFIRSDFQGLPTSLRLKPSISLYNLPFPLSLPPVILYRAPFTPAVPSFLHRLS